MALNTQPDKYLSQFQRIQVQKQHINSLQGWVDDLQRALKVQDEIIDELRRENAELRTKKTDSFFEEQL